MAVFINHIVRVYIAILVITLPISCKNDEPPSVPIEPAFTAIQTVDISVNGAGEINNCAKWYFDFTSLSRILLYDNKLICQGKKGGFLCLNQSDFSRDTILERQLNVDFFLYAGVFRDTLFARKFDATYYWNTDEWIKYKKILPLDVTLPSASFKIIREDNSYIFYGIDQGEFGTLFGVFNKRDNNTRAVLTGFPNSIIQTDTGFLVGSHSYHMMGSFYLFTMKDIEKLPLISDSLKYAHTMFDRDKRFEYLNDTNVFSPANFKLVEFKSSKMDWIIVSSFVSKHRLNHFIDAGNYRDTNMVTYIATIKDDSLVVFDSLKHFVPWRSLHANNCVVFYHYSGFSVLRNDTLFTIKIFQNKTDYNGPPFDDFGMKIDSSRSPSKFSEFIYYEDIPRDSDRPYGEISFQYDNRYRLEGYSYGFASKNFVSVGKKRLQLQFKDGIRNIFTVDNRLFIFLWEYGLLEVTDIDRFISHYRE